MPYGLLDVILQTPVSLQLFTKGLFHVVGHVRGSSYSS